MRGEYALSWASWWVGCALRTALVSAAQCNANVARRHVFPKLRHGLRCVVGVFQARGRQGRVHGKFFRRGL